MGSEVDHHQLTQERDQLRQQLAEANAARERAETDAAVLRVIVEKVEMLYFPYTGPGPTVAALIDEARTALSSGAGEKAAAVLALAPLIDQLLSFPSDGTPEMDAKSAGLAERWHCAVAAMEKGDG